MGVITGIEAGFGFVVETPDMKEYIVGFDEINWTYGFSKKKLGNFIYVLNGVGGTTIRLISLLSVAVIAFIIDKNKKRIFEIEEKEYYQFLSKPTK